MGGAAETISLPNGWLPEGIAIAPGGTFYSGSRANGAVYAGSLRTGEGDMLVPGVEGRVAVGVDHDRGRLFVAGGGDRRRLRLRRRDRCDDRSYDFAARRRTRSSTTYRHTYGRLVHGVEKRGPLQGSLGAGRHTGATFETVPLTSLGSATPPANSNGIDATPNGKTLIIVQSDPGKLFTVDPQTGVADEIELTGMSGNVFRGDGILLDGKTLYVVQNLLNQIAVVELETRPLGAGTIAGLITSPSFDVPTTIDEFGKWLYAVNARFTTPPDAGHDVHDRAGQEGLRLDEQPLSQWPCGPSRTRRSAHPPA